MKKALTTTTSSLLGCTQPSLQVLAWMQSAQMLMAVRGTRKPSKKCVMAIAICPFATISRQSCLVSFSELKSK